MNRNKTGNWPLATINHNYVGASLILANFFILVAMTYGEYGE